MKTQFETQELKLIANLIDVASQKGMFRGNELLTMGLLHKKIVDTIQATQPNIPETSEIPKEPYIKD